LVFSSEPLSLSVIRERNLILPAALETAQAGGKEKLRGLETFAAGAPPTARQTKSVSDDCREPST
jgi:hypothetical protein